MAELRWVAVFEYSRILAEVEKVIGRRLEPAEVTEAIGRMEAPSVELAQVLDSMRKTVLQEISMYVSLPFEE